MTRLLLAALAIAAFALGCSDGKPDARHATPTTSQSATEPTTSSPRAVDDFTIAVGSPEHRCVSTSNNRVVRAGDFVAGNFVTYREDWRADQPRDIGKLYWEPKDDQEVADTPLVISAAAVGSDTKSRLTWAFGGTGFAAKTIPFGRAFYPSGLHLPHRGLWRLTAVAGTQRGCFVFKL